MTIEFRGKVWYWKGPAPFYFVTVPARGSRRIKSVANFVTYGWGMIPVTARIGATEWTTALWEKDGRYIVPLKVAVRRAERIDEDDDVMVRLEIEQ